MTEEYTVLWKGVRSAASNGRDGVGYLGSGADEHASVRVTKEQLDNAQAVELAADTDVQAIAPLMPTRIIEPLAGTANNISKECWGIGAVGALTSGFTGKGVRVVVLDTGIERNHPAFGGTNIQEADFSGTGNGDKQGHGTHCAGTIFGREVDGVRIGVAPGVDRAFIGKVLRDDGRGTSDMIFSGLKWALDQNPDVISMSLGFDFPGQVQMRVKNGWPVDLATSQALEDYRRNTIIFEALMGLARSGKAVGRDPLVIAAAGNESKREVNSNYRITVSLPAVVTDLSVGAVQRDGQNYSITSFSNSTPDVVAPGFNIKSAWIGGGLHTISGTSMACPHVAGVAALWFESLKAAGDTINSGYAVRSHIIANARRDVLGANFSKVDFGNGLVSSPI